MSNSKFKSFRGIGINRVSLGVQALNNKDLDNLGRDHNKNQAIEAIEIINNWFKNYNLDLYMAGNIKVPASGRMNFANNIPRSTTPFSLPTYYRRKH